MARNLGRRVDNLYESISGRLASMARSFEGSDNIPEAYRGEIVAYQNVIVEMVKQGLITTDYTPDSIKNLLPVKK